MWLTFSFETFWVTKCWTPRYDTSAITLQEIFIDTPSLDGISSLGRELMFNNNTTCTLNCFSALRPLWSWNPQSNEPVSPLFLQSFYGLFLLFFRTQPDVLQNAQSTYHLIYSVTLDYSDRVVFRLLTRASEEATNPFCDWVHFILLS